MVDGAGLFQITGLGSGLDTNKIIDSMLLVERRPIDQLKLRQTVLQGRNTAAEALKGKLSLLLGRISPLLLQATVQGRSATSSQASAVSVNAGAGAAMGSFNVTVLNTATATQARSGAAIGKAVTANVTLEQGGFGLTPTSGTFSINGVSIAVDAAVDTLDDVIADINATFAGQVQASIVNDADGRPNKIKLDSLNGQAVQVGSMGDTSNFLKAARLQVAPGLSITSSSGIGATQANAILDNAQLQTPLAGAGSFMVNGVEIAYDPAVDSLNSAISRINNSTANVVASYDSVADKLVLRGKVTGSLSIALEDLSGNFLQATGVLNAAQDLGQNARFSIDSVDGGAVQTSTSNTVTGVVPGVTLNLLAATTGAATVTISQDTTAAVNAVNEFVTQFNDLLTDLRKQTGFDTTTKTAGPLAGDATMRRVADAVRQILGGTADGLDGPFSMLAQVGISFGKIGSAVGSTNTLRLEEGRLHDALTENPQAVQDLFSANTDTSTGVFVKLRDYPENAL